MPVIYDEFKLPKNCLINKPIPKDIFLEYGKMTEKSKERFNKYFKSAQIIYSLKYPDLKFDFHTNLFITRVRVCVRAILI